MELRKVRQGGGRSGVEAGVAKALGHGITRREEEIGSGWAPAVARTGAPAGNSSLAGRAGEKGAPEKEPTVEAEVGMVGRRGEQLSPPASAPLPWTIRSAGGGSSQGRREKVPANGWGRGGDSGTTGRWMDIARTTAFLLSWPP